MFCNSQRTAVQTASTTFCNNRSLPTKTMREEILKCVVPFFKEHEIDWSKYADLLTTDFDRPLSAIYSGFLSE